LTYPVCALTAPHARSVTPFAFDPFFPMAMAERMRSTTTAGDTGRAGVTLACALICLIMCSRWDACVPGLHAHAALSYESRIHTNCPQLCCDASRQTSSMPPCCFCPPLHANACLPQCSYARGNHCSSYWQPKNPAQILVLTKPGCTICEGHWLNPDLVGTWSHFPANSLPPQTRSIPMHSAFPNPLHPADTLSLESRFLNYSPLELYHTPALSRQPTPTTFITNHILLVFPHCSFSFVSDHATP